MSSLSASEDDESLFRSHAALLAQALRDADDAKQRPRQQTTLAHDTYRQLCFDDPVVTPEGCRSLAEALVKPSSSLALSNRLVQGVEQLCQRYHGRGVVASTNQTEETSASLLTPSVESTDTSGRTFLAWTVYGRIPLLILLSDHLEEAAALLGSFRARPEVEKVTFPEAQKKQQRGDTPDNAVEENADTAKADEPLEEIWAAESDPSDFDFGSEPPADRLAELEAWTETLTLEPTELSDVPHNTTWKDVANAVTDLLHGLSYTRALAEFTTASIWKREKIVDQLTQLTLSLFLPSTMQSGVCREFAGDTYWQQLALNPLHAFRDAVDEHMELLVEDYCNLLVLLLQADRYAGSQTSTPVEPVAPASLVGLSALATLCNSCLEMNRTSTLVGQQILRTLRDTIFRIVDDLARILESHEAAVPWACLSLWHVLARDLTSAQAQKLLQSGVFSQWMLSWQRQPNHGLRLSMQDSIFHLSCASPSLLGKYAWRFADFGATVTENSSGREATTVLSPPPWSAVFLWNLLGISLASQNTGGLVSLKKKEYSRPAPSAAVCRNRAFAAFESLCHAIANRLNAWKKCRVDGTQDEDDTTDDYEPKLMFDDFRTMVDTLSIPHIRLLLAKELKQNDAASLLITNALVQISRDLVAWPTHEPPEGQANQSTVDEHESELAEKDREQKDNADRHKRKVGREEMEDQAVACLRRDLKVLQSVLELDESAPALYSSKAD